MKVQYTKLDPEFKAKWVAALRSGEYEQGKKYLKNGGCYCCLGVACEIEGFGVSEKRGTIPTYKSLPKSLVPISGERIVNSTVYVLTEMNDNDGKTFPEIAEWIEKHL